MNNSPRASPRDSIIPSPRQKISETLLSPLKMSSRHLIRRTTDGMSRSMAISTARSSTNRSSVITAPPSIQINGTAVGSARGKGYPDLDLKDMINVQRNSNRVMTTYVSTLAKPHTHAFVKEVGKDFVSSVQKQNEQKMAPNHYQIQDLGGFLGIDNIKKVKFAHTKEARNSIIYQHAKKRLWVPGSNHYSPERKAKLVGNYLQ